MSGKNSIYWDSCVFIALLTNQPKTEPEMSGMQETIALVNQNKLNLVVSTVVRTEVLYVLPDNNTISTFRGILKRPNIVEIAVDSRIAEITQELKKWYAMTRPRVKKGKRPGIADFIHVATAIWAGAPTMHTFDGESNPDGLLSLSGQISKYQLEIIKPTCPQLLLNLIQ